MKKTITQLSLTKSLVQAFILCCLLLLIGNKSWGQVTGDFKSIASGNWNATGTWNTYNGSSWVAATATPGAGDNVYVETLHLITLTQAEACKDINIFTGASAATGRVACVTFPLSVNGKMRSYTGSAPGTTASTGAAFPFSRTSSSATGRVLIVGNSRIVTNTGEFGSFSNASGSTVAAIDIAMNANQTATFQTSAKFGAWTITSGTLDMGTFRLASDIGANSGSDIFIADVATLISAATGNSGGVAVMGRTGSNLSGTLTLNGNLILTGVAPSLGVTTITVGNNATVTYNLSGDQTLIAAVNSGAAMNTYNNLTIAGSGIKTLATSTTVNNSLTVSLGTLSTGANPLALGASASAAFAATTTLDISTSGSVNFNARPVTFQSSATSMARLSTINGTLSGATNVTVERYIPLGKRAYRFLTPMVTTSGSIRSNWQNGGTLTNNIGTHITGSTTGVNGFDLTTTGSASLFTFDNTGNTWNAISNTNTNTLTSGVGYRLLVRGDRRVNLSAASLDNMNDYTILKTTGTVVNGTGAAPADVVSGTGLPALNTTVGNFSLVGNPFVSPIDWLTVTRSAGLEDTYYVWDPNMGTTLQRGRYVAYSVATGFNNFGSSGVSNVGRYIQPGQAFFVKTTGASPVLTIKEADKASTFVSVFRTQSSFSNLAISLYEPSELANGYPIDGASSIFDNQFSASIGNGDIEKLATSGENVSIASNGKNLTIEARPKATLNDSVFIVISNLNQNNIAYALKIDAGDFTNNEQAWLVDRFLNTTQAINLAGAITMQFSTDNNNPASYAANRFAISFRSNNALPNTFLSVSAAQKNAGIEVSFTTANETNMASYDVEESNDGTTFTKATNIAAKNASNNSYTWLDGTIVNGDNYYRIKAMEKNGTVKYSNTVKVKIGGKGTEFAVYPNPVKGGVVNLQMSNVEKGIYIVKIFNNIGQEIVTKTINHTGGSATQTIGLGATIAQGNYRMQISNGVTTVLTKSIIVE